MANQFPLSISSDDIAIDLGESGAVYVAEQVAILAQSVGVFGSGYGFIIHVDGTVAGGGAGIRLLEGVPEVVSPHNITIGNKGVVFSFTTAIDIDHRGVNLTNNGRITASTALNLTPDAADDKSVLSNSGTIEGTWFGIYAQNAAGEIRLTNTGKIVGELQAYAGGTGADNIVNNGVMIGGLTLGGGSNLYDARGGGTINGAIMGGDGQDHIYCGSENNTVYGDGNDDWISGGKGADDLFGNAGADKFIFETASVSTAIAFDTIMDFGTSEGDLIDLELIDANTKQKGDQDFKYISGQAFHGIAGELRVYIKGSDSFIAGDIDGNRKADFVVQLEGAPVIEKQDFDF